MRLLGIDGLPHAHIRRLQEAGLILDVGHGTGSFSYEVAEGLLAQGVLPDVISSDIHQLAIQGPMFDLPTTLSKFLALGLSLPDFIERATARPAAAMRRPDLGSLRPGSPADLALFRLEEGDFTFHDVAMTPRPATTRLINTLTLVAGEELPRLTERPLQPWARLPDHQRALVSAATGE
jgi:dihydroorotase